MMNILLKRFKFLSFPEIMVVFFFALFLSCGSGNSSAKQEMISSADLWEGEYINLESDGSLVRITKTAKDSIYYQYYKSGEGEFKQGPSLKVISKDLPSAKKIMGDMVYNNSRAVLGGRGVVFVLVKDIKSSPYNSELIVLNALGGKAYFKRK